MKNNLRPVYKRLRLASSLYWPVKIRNPPEQKQVMKTQQKPLALLARALSQNSVAEFGRVSGLRVPAGRLTFRIGY